MKLFESIKHKDIKSKLMFMVMLVTTITVMLMSVMFVVYDVMTVKDSLYKELHLVGDIIGKRSAPALEYGLKDQAENHLTDLQSKPSIELACLYTSGGTVLAKYPALKGEECPSRGKERSGIEKNHVVIQMDISSSAGEVLGSLYLRSNLSQVYEHIIFIAPMVLVFILLLVFIAYVITQRVQAIISVPIQSLTKTAELVKDSGAYDTPAEKFFNDEVGELAEVFNDMMKKIKERDDMLESQVQERTATLEQTLSELQNALDAKKRFLTNMGHELRTPNHQLASYSKFINSDLKKLQEQLESASQQTPKKEDIEAWNKSMNELVKLAARLESACQKEARLIGHINDLDAMTSETIEYHIAENDLNDTVQNTIAKFHGGLSKRIIYQERGAEIKALFDKHQVIKVIDNLLSNAETFAPEGDITIKLKKTKYRTKSGDVRNGAQCTISDQGIGIPENELELIFELFGESSITRKEARGRGLGLTLCRETINAHKGRIWAENNKGKGASFHFILPVG